MDTLDPKHEAAMAEMRKRKDQAYVERLQGGLKRLEGFFDKGEPLDFEELKELEHMVIDRSYTDDEGQFQPSAVLHEVERGLGISSSRLYDMQRRDPHYKGLSDIFSRAQNAWRFMRNPQGDVSYTVPGSIRKEMVTVGAECMQEVDQFYKTQVRGNETFPQEEFERLETSVKQRISEVQKKANPYIAGDHHVAANHIEEYERLLGGFRDAIERSDNRDERSVNPEFARFMLAARYKTEYDSFVDQYKEQKIAEPELSRRNKVVELSNSANDRAKLPY